MALSRRQKLLVAVTVLGLAGLYMSANYIRQYGVYYSPHFQEALSGEQIQQHFRRSLARRIPIFNTFSDNDSAPRAVELSAQSRPEFFSSYGIADFKPSPLSLDTKAVILFSYMRAGSSFLGDVLFNLDSKVFYAFEPLAPLYVSMYGLEGSSVVDTDLIFWPNGTTRKFPPEEVEAITWMLSHVLTCNMSSFPLPMYGHHFWGWPRSLYGYQACISERQLGEAARSCQGYLQPACGNKFMDRHANPDLCFQKLWRPFWRKLNNISTYHSHTQKNDDASASYDKLFTLYHACLDTLRDAVYSCLPLLQKTCQESTLHAAKVVRGSMATLEKLMKIMPNLYVIHLYRDPRAVVRSRTTIDWSQGHYDGDDVSKLAETYCRRVAMDSRSRKALLKKYPDRLLEVVYDEVLEDPLPNIQRIFDFLDVEISEQSSVYIRAVKGDFRGYKERWTYEMTEAEKATIEKTCQKFTEETGFDWKRFDVPLDIETKSYS